MVNNDELLLNTVRNYPFKQTRDCTGETIKKNAVNNIAAWKTYQNISLLNYSYFKALDKSMS